MNFVEVDATDNQYPLLNKSKFQPNYLPADLPNGYCWLSPSAWDEAFEEGRGFHSTLNYLDLFP